MANKTPSSNELHTRYKDAETRLSTWKSRIKEVYRYCAPMRDDYEMPDGGSKAQDNAKGTSKTRHVFDSTAIEAGSNFANNLQLTLTPPLQEWINLSANTTSNGVRLTDEVKNAADKELQIQTTILFENLRKSNLDLAINEAFLDLYVGTAFMYVNESDGRAPFVFGTIPTRNVVYEVGADDKIENIWRVFELTGNQILESWDETKLLQSFVSSIKQDPTKFYRIIEGAVIIPDNSSDQKVYYYIQTELEKSIVFQEWRDISPFFGFRYQKSPGESFGRGPADISFPDIKTLNKLVEFMLTSAKWWAFPMYLVNQALTINPYNVRFEPGVTIPIIPDGTSQDPIRPVPPAGNPQVLERLIENARSSLTQRLFGEALGDVEATKGRSATEMNIRWQRFLQKNGAAAGRLAQELIFPIIDRSLRILKRKGILKDVEENTEFALSLDNKNIAINYNSPLLLLQNQQEITKFTQYIGLLLQLLGPPALATLELPETVTWLAKTSDIDLSLIRNGKELKKILTELTAALLKQIDPPKPVTTPFTPPLMNTPDQQGQGQ